jgi:uncharacterized membrane protein
MVISAKLAVEIRSENALVPSASDGRPRADKRPREICGEETLKEYQVAIANQTKTIVGVFNSVQDANAAVRDLEAQGISRDEISIVANKNASGYETMSDRDKTSDVVADAGIGAAIGGVGGLLLSAAGALTIPVIGPILAAGPIAAALTGAGIGAAAGGLIGALTESGVPEEHARYYAEGVRRGDVLVTVKADEAHTDRVCDVLDQHNAVDVDDRVKNWKNRGWSGWNESAQPYTSDELRKERSYYEAPDRSSIGTTGMTSAGLSGGTTSGYAGQPSGHVSGSDLSETRGSDRGYGEFADATKLDRPRTEARDPRDKDADGWVADDKMREWGRDIKDAVKGTGDKLDEAERRRRARVYDRTII